MNDHRPQVRMRPELNPARHDPNRAPNMNALASTLAGRPETDQRPATDFDGDHNERGEDQQQDNPHRMADALADKTANTLDLASASILERIRAVKARCETLEHALIDDINATKRQIHATIAFAGRAEDLAKKIDGELDAIVAERKKLAGVR